MPFSVNGPLFKCKMLTQQLNGIHRAAKIQEPIKIKPHGTLYAKQAAASLQHALAAREMAFAKHASVLMPILLTVRRASRGAVAHFTKITHTSSFLP